MEGGGGTRVRRASRSSERVLFCIGLGRGGLVSVCFLSLWIRMGIVGSFSSSSSSSLLHQTVQKTTRKEKRKNFQRTMTHFPERSRIVISDGAAIFSPQSISFCLLFPLFALLFPLLFPSPSFLSSSAPQLVRTFVRSAQPNQAPPTRRAKIPRIQAKSNSIQSESRHNTTQSSPRVGRLSVVWGL